MSLIDGSVKYDDQGRMKYHPKYHTRHGKRFTEDELIYLCKFWEIDNIRDLSLGLGKTEMTLASRITNLKKSGKYEVYKAMELSD
ncbi:hypothetical protein HMPREF1210_01163 [Paenisporosarcina sp. HGH0030]|uniref:hypothetical protein n=1 Tax=Paenisporosarcina sp. HGH0030 TaxID=1078085 RepID=UPI00034EB9D7|nr:hypothetical protein [Paenisporosarcina sp. HGH0030]EPD52783.1 hypothetical protein HMPREF1210_01163 [Paenisporosarcina sp. HGH0030]